MSDSMGLKEKENKDNTVVNTENSVNAANTAVAAKTKKEPSAASRLFLGVFRALVFGLVFGVILLVAEGVCRDNLINDMLGLSETSIVGGALLAFLIAFLENLFRWGYILSASKKPSFKKENFRGYFGVGFWVTLGIEVPICLATFLGGGVLSYTVRITSLVCVAATLIVMAVCMWRGRVFGGILWPTILYFLWLAPLTILLPGSNVITASERSIITFELVYGGLLCLVALIVLIRNWTKSRAPKTVKKESKKADTETEPLSSVISAKQPDANAGSKSDMNMNSAATTAANSDHTPESKYISDSDSIHVLGSDVDKKDHSKVEDRYSGESVEDKYL